MLSQAQTATLSDLANSFQTFDYPEIKKAYGASTLTDDGGIQKMITKEGSCSTEYVRGTNVKLRWTAWAFIPIQDVDSKEKTGDCKKNSANIISPLEPHHHDTLDSSHSHGKDSCCKAVEAGLSDQKPVRTKVSCSDDYDNIPFELRMGYSFSFAALETCVGSMRVGEVARFLCLPPHTEGFVQLETTLRSAKDPGIAPLRGCCGAMANHSLPHELAVILSHQSPLELEIQILTVQQPGSFEQDVWEMSVQDKWNTAPVEKEAGVKLFKEGNVELALKKFERSVMMLESLIVAGYGKNAPLEAEGKDLYGMNSTKLVSLLLASRSNYVLCKLKTGDYVSVIKQCAEVLKMDPENEKAFFRRGVAYARLGRDLEFAKADLTRCEKTVEVVKELKALGEKERLNKDKEKKMWNGMFTK